MPFIHSYERNPPHTYSNGMSQHNYKGFHQTESFARYSNRKDAHMTSSFASDGTPSDHKNVITVSRYLEFSAHPSMEVGHMASRKHSCSEHEAAISVSTCPRVWDHAQIDTLCLQTYLLTNIQRHDPCLARQQGARPQTVRRYLLPLREEMRRGH